MSGDLVALLAVNALYLAAGAGLLPLLRVARSPRELLARLPLAYMIGVAAAGILGAHLAMIDVPLGLPQLVLLALVALGLGVRRLVAAPGAGAGDRAAPARSLLGPEAIVASATTGVTILLLVIAAPAFASRPLVDWDGWAVWGLKAKALLDFDGVSNPVFFDAAYAPLHVDYPILLPSLEATGFRAMGGFDGALIHVQLLALAAGFVAALWGLLRGRVPLAALGLSSLALIAAPAVLTQLLTNYADIPLAFFVALGVAALGRWLVAREGWALACAALFLGAATLTKNEGTLFAGAALAALLATSLVVRRGRRDALIASAAVIAIVLPWRLYAALHGLKDEAFGLHHLASPTYLREHADRVSPSAAALWEQIVSTNWGLVPALFAVALLAALLARRGALAAFTAVWLVLSFAGLVAVYWVTTLPVEEHLLFSADRTVTSLVIGAAALAPLLVAEVWWPPPAAAVPSSDS